MAKIEVLGAGIVGVWQALILQRAGHQVTLRDPAGIPSKSSASSLAGAMLAPWCEGEASHEAVRELGIRSLAIWFRDYPPTVRRGSLVVALPRDQAELTRFAGITEGYRWVGEDEIAGLEPALADRFRRALFYEHEAHVEPAAALDALAQDAIREGVEIATDGEPPAQADWIIDCRGLAARDDLKTLRGVRGERIVIETPEVSLTRPVRMLHPRIPLYVVPWSGNRFMVGATVIESEDKGLPTVRSIMELLAAVYALEPGFGEARIVHMEAGVRPAFPDNLPRVIVRGRRLFVNGLYRHGFLLAPVLAEMTAAYIESGEMHEGVVVQDHGEW
jgi:glycine oxidase